MQGGQDFVGISKLRFWPKNRLRIGDAQYPFHSIWHLAIAKPKLLSKRTTVRAIQRYSIWYLYSCIV